MKKIVCFHLFNDYSGSPKVLKMVLEGLLKKGVEINLVTSKGGALDELVSYENLQMHSYWYRFSTSGLVTMVRYCLVQIYTFLFAFRWVFQKGITFYINTLLPVGPALAGRLMGKRVVYHYHENASAKGAFYKGLAWAMEQLAHEIVCVSGYQASFLKKQKKVTVIPNALPQAFVDRLVPNMDEAFARRTVLMLSSLKEYKGTREFMKLAEKMTDYQFLLVINDTQESIDHYILNNQLNKSSNIRIYSRQSDVAPFYNQASLVLNLTNSKMAIETFGLTALEAMTAGLPVIVPTVGGIAEMVEDGVNGYKLDVQEMDKIADCIQEIFKDKDVYLSLAQKAHEISKNFSEKVMLNRIADLL